MCLTHRRREVPEFLIELLELNTLNESTFCMNFYCVENTFLLGKNIFGKGLKLVKGATKPLKRQKTLKVLTKF